jgi:hypothetical protein
MSGQAGDPPGPVNPYAPPPPGWQPPAQPPQYGVPPGWQPQPPPPPPYAAPPGWKPPPPEPPPYGAPPGWQPPPPAGGGYPQYGHQSYGYPAPGSTNGFAIASLVCAIVLAVVPFLGGGLGVIFGIIGTRQCARNGERGKGLAIAGIVIGAIAIAFWILGIIGLAINHHHNNGSGGLGAIIY